MHARGLERHDVTPGSPSGDAAVLRQARPWRRLVEALGEAHAELAGLAVRGAVLDAGAAAADVADRRAAARGRSSSRRGRPGRAR